MSEDKKDKPTYQAPKVMPLGELVKGEGQNCRDGGSAGLCRAGGTAAMLCRAGSTASGVCRPGTTARGTCWSGTIVV